MAPTSEVADREVMYRGFRIKVGASRRFGGILVAANLTGGPDGIARQFGVPSTETNVECACAMALHELRKVVDDLLEGHPGAQPVEKVSRRPRVVDDEDGRLEA